MNFPLYFQCNDKTNMIRITIYFEQISGLPCIFMAYRQDFNDNPMQSQLLIPSSHYPMITQGLVNAYYGNYIHIIHRNTPAHNFIVIPSSVNKP